MSVGPPGDDGDRAPPIVAIVGVSSPSKRFADRGPTRRPIDRARSQCPDQATLGAIHDTRDRARPDRRPDPGPSSAQRDRGERPPRRHRRGRRQRPCPAPARRSGPAGHPPLDGQAVRAARAHRGRRDRGVRSRAGGAGGPCQLAFGRGHARANAPGDLPPVGREPGPARMRIRWRPARRADRRAPGPRRREGRPGPAHVLGPAHRLAPAVPAPRLGPDGLLEAEPPLADRLPRGGGDGLRHHARQAAHRDRRLRGRDVRVPAARDRARLRDAGRPHGDPVGRPASRARGIARDRS